MIHHPVIWTYLSLCSTDFQHRQRHLLLHHYHHHHNQSRIPAKSNISDRLPRQLPIVHLIIGNVLLIGHILISFILTVLAGKYEHPS